MADRTHRIRPIRSDYHPTEAFDGSVARLTTFEARRKGDPGPADPINRGPRSRTPTVIAECHQARTADGHVENPYPSSEERFIGGDPGPVEPVSRCPHRSTLIVLSDCHQARASDRYVKHPLVALPAKDRLVMCET